MKYGAVLFDEVLVKRAAQRNRKRVPRDGWASIAGEPPMRIKSIAELASDVKWLTNLEFVDFYSNQLGNHPNFLPSNFLRTEVKAICDDIGASIDHVSVEQSVTAVAMVFHRVMTMATDMLRVNPDITAIKTLHEMLAARVVNKHKIPDEVNEALRRAFQTRVQCVTRYQRDWKSITLRVPRYSHALDVLSTPVPSEFQWEYIDGARLPASNAERVDWCIASEIPVLANVVVNPRRGSHETLISYASGASMERAWVCQPELLWLSQFCDIEIIGVFASIAGFEPQKEIEQFPTLGDFSFASYSLGLLAENFWVSLANFRTNAVQAKFYPPRAVWYRAMDRFSLFLQASRLARYGFQVAGYGYGSIWLNYPTGGTDEVIAAAVELGLDVPVSKYHELKIEKRIANDE